MYLLDAINIVTDSVSTFIILWKVSSQIVNICLNICSEHWASNIFCSSLLSDCIFFLPFYVSVIYLDTFHCLGKLPPLKHQILISHFFTTVFCTSTHFHHVIYHCIHSLTSWNPSFYLFYFIDLLLILVKWYQGPSGH